MKTTANLLKHASGIFLILFVILWAYAGYCDNTTLYSYNPKGKLDPFKPFMEITDSDQKLRRSTPRSPLQKISINRLKLVGISGSKKRRVAMVKDPGGRVYFLFKGNFIGLKKGRVEKILTDRVIFVERVEGPSRKIKRERIVLELRPEENGGKP